MARECECGEGWAVGQTLTVDAALGVGAAATEVTVTSESPILDPQKTEVAQTLGSTLIANLPVATRNWSDFVLLTPNVTQDGPYACVSRCQPGWPDAPRYQDLRRTQRERRDR
jgi:hypothetical protein